MDLEEYITPATFRVTSGRLSVSAVAASKIAKSPIKLPRKRNDRRITAACAATFGIRIDSGKDAQQPLAIDGLGETWLTDLRLLAKIDRSAKARLP